MKQIFTLTAITLFSVFSLQAQVKLTRATHGFKANETHQSQPMKYQQPGESGINRVWDFSALTPIGNEKKSEVSTSNDAAYNTEISELDGFTYLFNVTDNGIEYRGYKNKTGEAVTYYSTPILKIKYPETYGTFFDGSFEGTSSFRGEQTGTITNGYYLTNVDATGTIILPGNISLPVIRVKTIERFTTHKGSCDYTSEIEKYLWYAQDIRYPVFVTLDVFHYNPATGEKEGVSRATYMNTNRDPKKQGNPVDNTPANAESFDIFCTATPNPFVNNVQISYTLPEELPVSIELYSMVGTKLAVLLPKQIQKGNQVRSFEIGKYTQNKGVYFVRITAGSKVFNEKLIKQ